MNEKLLTNLIRLILNSGVTQEERLFKFYIDKNMDDYGEWVDMCGVAISDGYLILNPPIKFINEYRLNINGRKDYTVTEKGYALMKDIIEL